MEVMEPFTCTSALYTRAINTCTRRRMVLIWPGGMLPAVRDTTPGADVHGNAGFECVLCSEPYGVRVS
jgi:hypothetical protein